jgi:hypothetical protein
VDKAKSEDATVKPTARELDNFQKGILAWKKAALEDLNAHALENLTIESVETVARDVRYLLNDPKPHAGSPEERVLKVWREAGNKLLGELNSFWIAERTIFFWAALKRNRPIVVPPLFSSILSMKDNANVDGVNLANAFQAFFAEYLKTDSRLFSLVTIEMLRAIGLQNEELVKHIETHATQILEKIQQQFGPIGTALAEIDARLKLLARDQNEKFALLLSRVDVLLAMMSTQPSPAMSLERWA